MIAEEPSANSNGPDNSNEEILHPLDTVTEHDTSIPSPSDQLKFILKDLDELETTKWTFTSTYVPQLCDPFIPKCSPGPILQDSHLNDSSQKLDYFDLFYTVAFLQQVNSPTYITFQLLCTHVCCVV